MNLDADSPVVQKAEKYLRAAYRDDTEAPNFTQWSIELVEIVLSHLASQSDEGLRLTLEDIKKVVYDYAIEVCMARKEWNWTKLIQKYLDTHLAKVQPIIAAKDAQIAALKAQLAEKDKVIEELLHPSEPPDPSSWLK